MGTIRHSSSGKPCLPWVFAAEYIGIHIVEDMFPDGSAENARNFCRNPDDRSSGPWCMTGLGKEETCSVPYCGKYVYTELEKGCYVCRPSSMVAGSTH